MSERKKRIVLGVTGSTASTIAALYLGQFDSLVTLIAGALKEWGVTFLGPKPGLVASGNQGMRLLEPRDIAVELANRVVAKTAATEQAS